MRLRILFVLAVAVLGSGCLVGETGHTLYLDPEGSVTWTVLEQDVRSDADKPRDVIREEREFLDRLASGRHPVTEGLDSLLPDALETRILRGERPFSVYTTARFAAVDRLAQDVLDQLGIRGRAVLRCEDGLAHLALTVDVHDGDGEDRIDDAPVMPLLEDLEGLRVVLTRGKFVDAAGFTLSDDGSTAVLAEPDDQTEAALAQGELGLSLTWTTGEPSTCDRNR
jgi:hypothetical protein